MTWYVEIAIGRLVTANLCFDVSQWVIIDAKVYNLSRFKDMHPGGVSVLLDEEIRELGAYVVK